MAPDRLEEALLGGPRRYTRAQVNSLAGTDPDRTRELWRAMGFPDAGDEDVAFTDADVEALRLLTGLLRTDVIEPGRQVSVARAVAQAVSRLAETQAGLLGRVIAERPPGETEAELVTALEQVLPAAQALLVYVWRRQLAAAVSRAVADPAEFATPKLSVGFADLVGFTSLSRGLSEDELAAVIERFEGGASGRVAERGGRVVKTLGDEVMYVADDVRTAADIALDIAGDHAADAELPDVRIGVATGSVLARFGDVYGSVVNIAARLTSLAHPASVLVDRETGELLAGHPAYDLHALRSQRVRGYGHLAAYVLRRGRH